MWRNVKTMVRLLIILSICFTASHAFAIGKWKTINNLENSELKPIAIDLLLKPSCKNSTRYKPHKTIQNGRQFSIDPNDNVWGPCKTDLPKFANPKGRGSERMEVASSRFKGEFIFSADYYFHQPVSAKRTTFFQLHDGGKNVAPPSWFGLSKLGCFIEAHQKNNYDKFCSVKPMQKFKLRVHWKTGEDGFIKYEINDSVVFKEIKQMADSPYVKFGMYAIELEEKQVLDIINVTMLRVVR